MSGWLSRRTTKNVNHQKINWSNLQPAYPGFTPLLLGCLVRIDVILEHTLCFGNGTGPSDRNGYGMHSNMASEVSTHPKWTATRAALQLPCV
jgi:hypothetical protein